MSNIFLIFIFIGLLSPSLSQSKTYSYNRLPGVVAEEIDRGLMSMKESFREMPENGVALKGTRDGPEEVWYLSRIRFLLYPFVKFKFVFFKFKIRPMVEFRWGRKPPKGWKNYDPTN
jgi:hypothetical protein